MNETIKQRLNDRRVRSSFALVTATLIGALATLEWRALASAHDTLTTKTTRLSRIIHASPY